MFIIITTTTIVITLFINSTIIIIITISLIVTILKIGRGREDAGSCRLLMRGQLGGCCPLYSVIHRCRCYIGYSAIAVQNWGAAAHLYTGVECNTSSVT